MGGRTLDSNQHMDLLRQDEFFMQLALRLGEEGRMTAPPNPWVGCVIVKNGEIVGRGYHESPGKPHAEIVALKEAGMRAIGATAYVSLEPCSHYGRTPPCINEVLASGISRVVIPFTDPDPQVSGRGIEALKITGVQVTYGVCEEEARKSLAPYLHHRKHHIPYIVLKGALSLDGKIAAPDGSSQWITGEKARWDTHKQRAESQAILIGAQTALIDKPRLNVRGIESISSSPLRVIVDGRGIVPAEGPLFDLDLGKTLIFTSNACNREVLLGWEKRGVEVISLGEEVDLREACLILGKRGVLQLLVEGGSTLFQSFIEKKLFSRLSLYFGSCLLGNGLPFYAKENLLNIAERLKLKLEDVRRFDDDVRLDYSISEE